MAYGRHIRLLTHLAAATSRTVDAAAIARRVPAVTHPTCRRRLCYGWLHAITTISAIPNAVSLPGIPVMALIHNAAT